MRYIIGLLVLAAACDSEATNSSAAFVVTDSAGVELVQNGDVGALGRELLQLTEEQRIGTVDGPEALQFFRVGPIAQDEAGSLHVANNGSGEIRTFSRAGDFMRAVGRSGSGPGEFQFISAVIVDTSTVVAVDGRLSRATVFAPDGSVRETWPLRAGPVSVTPFRRADGGWLVSVVTRTAEWPYSVGIARQDTTRIAWLDSATLAAFGAAGGSAMTSALREVVRYPRGRIYGITSPRTMTANSPVWEPRPNHAVDGYGRIYVSPSNPYQIDVFDHAGRLVRRLRRAHEPVPVTDELLDRYAQKVETYFDTATNRHGEWDIEVASQTGRLQLPRVAVLPALGRVLASHDGDLWVERLDVVSDPVLLEWSREGSPESIWDVFAASGQFMGTVQLPERFAPRTITGSQVIGVLRDDLDVEYVARYRIAAWPQRE